MVDKQTKIKIGGVMQKIHIITEDEKNPVILFIHGGPGGINRHDVMHNHRDLLDRFTLVGWDQRGVGGSYTGVDFESMNYSQCTFTSDDALLMNQSNQITDELKAANNIKCGGEFRYGPFMFRAGYAMYGNPYKNATDDKFYRNDYSAGVGLATNTVYCDLAWLRAKSKQTNDFYRDLKGNIVNSSSTIKRDNITFTIGFKF